MGPLISGWMEETWFSLTASMSMTDIRTKGFLQKCASQKQNLVIRTPELKRRQRVMNVNIARMIIKVRGRSWCCFGGEIKAKDEFTAWCRGRK